jgi:FKBP-type peptidyl-prolyl cis-trans isomerase 2
VIPGFEAGIAKLKKGDTSTIMVLPKDGYGEASIVRTVRESEVAPEFTLTTDRSRFEDTIVESVARSVLGEQGKSLTVGQTLTGGADVVAKVTKIDGDTITLTIDNKDHPFYGKKLAIGGKATKDNIAFTIKDLSATGITLLIANGNSPFVGKEFVVGASASLPVGPTGVSPGEMKVMAISGEAVSVSMPNTHPLAGKTLYFEVEILDIK